MSILFAILLFSLLIFVHELGHFVAAKLSGVQVNEFAVFMGPAIFKKQVGQTLYSLRCIPFGGYCAMEGEDEDSDNPHAFGAAAWWKRLIILVAGAAMNFIAGIVIIAVVLSCTSVYPVPQVSEVQQWSEAGGESGLQPGDTILKFNGKKISIYQDFTLATMLLPDGEYDILVDRGGERVMLEDVPMVRKPVQNEDGSTQMLYGLNFSMRKTTPESVPGRILPTAMSYVDSVVISLKMLVSGQAGVQDMSGPVGIVNLMSETAEAANTTRDALLVMLEIGGLIAINLAVMNLLPIPALDGGRAVCLLITTAVEAVTRKKINPKYEAYLHTAGMILLLGLMAVITFKDIFNIFKR